MKKMTTIAATLFAFSAMAAIAQDAPAPAPETPEAAAPAAPAGPLWLMSCTNEAQVDQLLCEFSQSIVATQNGQAQRIATASFNRVAGTQETNADFVLPYGVSLPEPARVLVDGDEVATLAWQSCDTGGCYASAPVDAAWLAAMRDGTELTTAFTAGNGQEVTLGFQLSGFTRAEDMLP